MGRRKDKKGRVLKDGEYQRKDGSYEFKYEDGDGVRKSVYSWRLIESDITPSGKHKGISLREKEREIYAKRYEGVFTNQKTTLNDLFRLHMKVGEFSDATAENYIYMWSRFVEKTLGRKKACDLKKSDILSFYARQKEKGLANGTIHVFQKMIHPSLELAVSDHIIRDNPSNGCCKAYPKGESTRQALTDEEMNVFMECLKNYKSRQRYELLFTIMIGTACRIGEIMGLTWKDIDMDERIISVDHEILYRKKDGKFRFYAKNTKTEKGKRIIPMSEEVYECFKKLQETRFLHPSMVEIDGYTDFVFTSMNGKPLYPANINKALYKIVDRYNLDRKELLPHISNHIFRHTGCTRMAEAEIDINTLKYIMGHEDIRMILKVYDHINLERTRKQMKKLDNKGLKDD